MEQDRKKILIADDNKSFLMYMAILLKRMGFNVILAENGAETIKLMKMMEPDLVLLDYYMPVLDGMSVLRFIKEDSQISHINVVMVTVDTSKETRKKSEGFESCGYLKKPVDIDELHDILQNCIFRPLGFIRKYPRVPFTERVSLVHEGTNHDLFAESLSAGGIYLRMKNPLPVGSHVEISLPLNGSAPLCLMGRVIYVKGLYADLFRVPPGMAIEFQDTTQDTSALLSNYIKEILAKDIWEDQEETIIKKKKPDCEEA